MSTRSDPRELERQRILYNSLATGGGRIDKSDHFYRSSTMHKRLSGHVEQEVQGLDDPTLRTHTTACEEACSEQRRVHGIPERESWVSSGQERDWSIDKSYLRNATIMSSTITYITIHPHLHLYHHLNLYCYCRRCWRRTLTSCRSTILRSPLIR